MDYCKINGIMIPYSNDFTMKKVPRIVSSAETMGGKVVSDFNGFKYENATLQWDTLLETDLLNLLQAIQYPSVDFTFIDIDGVEKTVPAIVESRVNTKTRFKRGGVIVWKDINVELSFPGLA